MSYMNSVIRIPLNLDAEQAGRLLALQAAFSQVCNVLSPVAAHQRCWSRVTLHHLMYRTLRDQFPALSSQMICNAIYMVCKMSRLTYQNPGSPFHVATMGDKALPFIRFAANCPVYFDSHTLSMKSGQLSIFTLGGRMRFALDLLPAQMVQFASRRVREITLHQRPDGIHELSFFFEMPALAALAAKAVQPVTVMPESWPDYLQVEEVR